MSRLNKKAVIKLLPKFSNVIMKDLFNFPEYTTNFLAIMDENIVIDDTVWYRDRYDNYTTKRIISKIYNRTNFNIKYLNKIKHNINNIKKINTNLNACRIENILKYLTNLRALKIGTIYQRHFNNPFKLLNILKIGELYTKLDLSSCKNLTELIVKNFVYFDSKKIPKSGTILYENDMLILPDSIRSLSLLCTNYYNNRYKYKIDVSNISQINNLKKLSIQCDNLTSSQCHQNLNKIKLISINNLHNGFYENIPKIESLTIYGVNSFKIFHNLNVLKNLNKFKLVLVDSHDIKIFDNFNNFIDFKFLPNIKVINFVEKEKSLFGSENNYLFFNGDIKTQYGLNYEYSKKLHMNLNLIYKPLCEVTNFVCVKAFTTNICMDIKNKISLPNLKKLFLLHKGDCNHYDEYIFKVSQWDVPNIKKIKCVCNRFKSIDLSKINVYQKLKTLEIVSCNKVFIPQKNTTIKNFIIAVT
jgi:hypothetical protein